MKFTHILITRFNICIYDHDVVANRKEKLVPEGLITSGQMVYDVIYKPLETPFLKMAREAGAKTLNGMGWMIYGSVDSLRLFIHQEPDVEVMYAAARKLAKDSGW